MKAVIFDFYGTLAETPDWGPSWQKMVADVGYELPDDVRDRWWNDGLDGTEHDEHSQSRDHYVAWQQSRIRGMLADCGIPSETQDELIARVREIGAHRSIARLRRSDRGAGRVARPRAHARDLLQLGLGSRRGDRSRRPHGRASTRRCRRHGSARGSRTRASTTSCSSELGIAPDDALFVGDTWSCDVEGPRAEGPATGLRAARRTSVPTRPHRPTTTTNRSTGPPTSASCSTWTDGSVDGAVVALPVGRAEIPLQHLQRPRQRQRLGADLDRLRHLVAGDRLAARAR